MPLARPLKQHAARQANKQAAVVGGQSLNYQELWARTGRIYAALASLPRRPRDGSLPQHIPVFALAVGNHPVVIELLATALARRCCIVLMDPAWPTGQLREALASTSPDIFICANGRADAATPGLPVLCPDADINYEEWRDAAEATSDTSPPPGDDPFLIGFTSGTTSQPKAFMRSRETWRASAKAGRSHFNLDANSHTLAPGPLSHGLTLYAFMETLDAGATFYALPRFQPSAVWQLLSQKAIGRLVAVPTVLEALCRHADDHGETLPALGQVTTAGARLERHLLERVSNVAPNTDITEYYGASELGFVSTAHHDRKPDGTLDLTGNRVGQAFPGVALSIRDGGQELPPGQAGMIYVRSPQVIGGYVSGDDGSGLRRDGPWASVGDLGKLDSNGTLTLLGRCDDMVITGGNNVYPDEIAVCLCSLPDIVKALVLGRTDTYLGQALVAVVEFAAGAVLTDAATLTAACSSVLPRYKIPRQFFTLADWPLTATGKIETGTVQKWMNTGDQRLLPL